MERHYTILGALYLGLGLMGLIGMLVILFIFFAGSAIIGVAGAQEPDFPAIVALLPIGLGMFISLMIAITTIPCFIAGYGLFRQRSWSPIAALIVGILNLPSFPFGTAVGVYSIWFYAELK